MDGREQAIQYLTQMKRDLTAKRERLLRPLEEVNKELEGVSTALALALRANAPIERDTAEPQFPLKKLRGLTHTQALVEIAKYNGGALKAQDAKIIMIRAGVMRNTRNSTHMVHGAIARSDAFARIGRGEYRLKEFSTRGDGSDSIEGHPVQ